MRERKKKCGQKNIESNAKKKLTIIQRKYAFFGSLPKFELTELFYIFNTVSKQ